MTARESLLPLLLVNTAYDKERHTKRRMVTFERRLGMEEEFQADGQFRVLAE
jgi:hypothetical protein